MDSPRLFSIWKHHCGYKEVSNLIDPVSIRISITASRLQSVRRNGKSVSRSKITVSLSLLFWLDFTCCAGLLKGEIAASWSQLPLASALRPSLRRVLLLVHNDPIEGGEYFPSTSSSPASYAFLSSFVSAQWDRLIYTLHFSRMWHHEVVECWTKFDGTWEMTGS